MKTFSDFALKEEYKRLQSVGDKFAEINQRDSKAWVGKGDVLVKLGNTQMILEKQIFIEVLLI